jgi:AcrR family transcriptional regulator
VPLGRPFGQVRSTEETRRLILDAATAEFAARGLSGARVDRIAASSGVNKRIIYVHFGSKEDLFDRVLTESLGRMADAVPFDGYALDEYAGDMFDFLTEDPTLARLYLWRALERPRAVRMEEESYAEKLALIDEARASAAGPAPDDDLEAAEIVAFVIALAQSWLVSGPTLAGRLSEEGSDRKSRRRHIELAVRRMLGDAP